MTRIFPNEAEWLAYRADPTRITASEAAMVLGLSPYGGPRELWLRKVAPALARFAKGGQLERGLRAEADMRAIAMARMGSRMGFGYVIDSAPYMVVEHPDLPWLSATPDGFIGYNGLAELKTDATRGADGDGVWPADGTEIRDIRQQSYDATGETDPRSWLVRPDYYVQCVVQMACTDRVWVDLWVRLLPFGDVEYRRIRIHRDLAHEREILTALRRWRADHLLGEQPPDGGPGDDDDALLRVTMWRYPAPTKRREMTGEEEALARQIVELQEAIDEMDSRRKALKGVLRETMGDAKNIDGAVFSAVQTTNFRFDVKRRKVKS